MPCNFFMTHYIYIVIKEVPYYLASTLVRRFYGKHVGENSLQNWMEINQGAILDQIPSFHIMSRGWILFRLHSQLDKHRLMECNWSWVPSRLILKMWQVDFDARRGQKKMQHVWVILLRFPMIFWQKLVLEAIRDKLGRLISLEENWDKMIDR